MLRTYFHCVWLFVLVQSDMILSQYTNLIYLWNLQLLVVGLEAGVLQHPHISKLSIGSIVDATMNMMQPIFGLGSNRCETFKSFFGLTYEQMLKKNSTDFHEILNIDMITKSGNVKFNLTASKRLNRLMASAQTVVILIHGFLESSDGWMVNGVAPELLKNPELVIFALDGRKIINLEYLRSSTYIRFMGDALGGFLADAINHGQDPSKIYLIGHSLGAHIAGIAGKKVYQVTKQLLGRITGLDPAGPCFGNVSSDGKLERTDAVYVDVIHTNGGILGLKEPVGHKDFFPNGGSSQPGCLLSTCDHSRAWEYFAESVSSTKNFPARRCANWTMYTQGLCTKNEFSFMGFNSEVGSTGLYFLSTNRSAPYGVRANGNE